jgi:hypothetical protein
MFVVGEQSLFAEKSQPHSPLYRTGGDCNLFGEPGNTSVRSGYSPCT